ncbi:MAG: hypothetical protein JO297_06210 [Nitrososphaeraceae archaeon]|nr:hypothetical protein [Nitrososphaeraceae archaeon]
MQPNNTYVRCNTCEINIDVKDLVPHTSTKGHRLKKTALECKLWNFKFTKWYPNDISIIAKWIEDLSCGE